jgi:spore maturation protein CgeB
MKVLYIGLKHDYGDPRRGLSLEHVNFYGTLTKMRQLDVSYFAFDEVLRSLGREEMNRRLLDMVEKEQPNVCFFLLFVDEFYRRTIESVSKKSVTINWFADDHWRFESFSRHWAPFFHWVATTDSCAVEKYHSIGCRNVIKTQWACNTDLCYPRNIPVDHDVTFVGARHSNRTRMVNALRRAGVAAEVWGKGWPFGRLGQSDMIEMFCRSKINLNFTEGSTSSGFRRFAKVMFKRRADGTLHLNNVSEISGMLSALIKPSRPQVKARNFEIPGCGGFLMTSDADNLSEYHVPGKEVVLFSSPDDLVEKIRYYLVHEDERERIRLAGYERTIRDHTYERRFSRIFQTLGITG